MSIDTTYSGRRSWTSGGARARDPLARGGDPEQGEERGERNERAHVPREHERVAHAVEGEGADRLRHDERGGRRSSSHDEVPEAEEGEPEDDPRVARPMERDRAARPESREPQPVRQLLEARPQRVQGRGAVDDALRDRRVGERKAEVHPRPEVDEERQQEGRTERAPELAAVVEQGGDDRDAGQEDALHAKAHGGPGREPGEG